MLIQPILFPPEYLSKEPDLFFRGIDAQNISEDKVSIPAGSTLSLETYFNAFSVGKWVEYTTLDNLSLCLEIQGDVEINAYHVVGSVDADFFEREHNKYPEQELIRQVNEKSYIATSEKIAFTLQKKDYDYTVTFNRLFEEGIFYVTIRALSDALLCGGFYSTNINIENLKPVKFAIGICTFKREEAVKSNVSRIISEIIENPKSPLVDKLEVYIADNGQTLDKEIFNCDKVHLFPNPNLGGAGGFTRTMIEAMFYDRVKNFTNIIFMDDDIMLYPSVLERNYFLCQMLKQKYHKSILGAEMLYLDKKYIQHAAGVLYEDNRIDVARANHKFFDFRNPSAVSANEVVNETNHTGWYYACIPRTIINEKNLPMPYFVHFDDIEYGIRNIKNKEIYINGIAIWHPAFKGKSPFWMNYYDVRNRLITMFSKPLDRDSFNKYLSKMSQNIILKIVQYNYEGAELILDAIQAFIKGPTAFIALNALALHMELLKKKSVYIAPQDIGFSRESIKKETYRNYKKSFLVQIIYLFIPVKNKIKAINSQFFYLPFNYAKLYLYEEEKEGGIIYHRNLKKAFELLFSLIKIRREIKRKYYDLLNAWQAAKPTLTSLSFWEKYLGLNKN